MEEAGSLVKGNFAASQRKKFFMVTYAESENTTRAGVIEAEVVDASRDGVRPRGFWLKRRIGPVAMAVTLLLLPSVLVGFLSEVVCGAADALSAQVANVVADGSQANADESVVSAGMSVVADDGMDLHITESYIESADEKQGQPMVVTDLLMQNASDKRVVLCSQQLSAVDTRGRRVNPYEQAIAGEDDDTFYQFIPTCIEPGEQLTIRMSFAQASEPDRIVYTPLTESEDVISETVELEIGEMLNSA